VILGEVAGDRLGVLRCGDDEQAVQPPHPLGQVAADVLRQHLVVVAVQLDDVIARFRMGEQFRP
jgi:hypothetical protein